MILWLDPAAPPRFPPTSQALAEPNGLLAAGGALTVPWLLAAYRRGIFPWYQEGQPILWWSPSPRLVLLPEAFRLHRSLRKRLREKGWQTSVDVAFAEVIRGCAARPEGTWITTAIIQAYETLHRLGYAHSIETWYEGELVGGLYGVCLDRLFFGESMFHRRPDASKIALARLVYEALRRGIGLIDCQMSTLHLRFMGANEIPRSLFEAYLSRAIAPYPQPQRWSKETPSDWGEELHHLLSTFQNAQPDEKLPSANQ